MEDHEDGGTRGGGGGSRGEGVEDDEGRGWRITRGGGGG